MSGGIRLVGLGEGPVLEGPPPVDHRTAAATEAGDCESCHAGHHSHWIPMRKSTQDPVGLWARIVSIEDTGLVLSLEDGSELVVFHHDMCDRNGLSAVRRVWVQLQWGWLWTDSIGFSVSETLEPCIRAERT